jgi:hypothetical protein
MMIMSERASANFLKGSFRVNFSMGIRTGTRGYHERTTDSKIMMPLCIAGWPLRWTLRTVRIYVTSQRSRRTTGRPMAPMSRTEVMLKRRLRLVSVTVKVNQTKFNRQQLLTSVDPSKVFAKEL